MSFVATDYKKNARAPQNKWVGVDKTIFYYGGLLDGRANTYYGQCVTYAKAVAPDLPTTPHWKRGDAVKGSTSIVEGTVIATFHGGSYVAGENHTAVYVKQDVDGIYVWDQYIAKDPKTAPAIKSKPVGPRLLRFGAPHHVNNGDEFYVVERS
jgi:hypothetical protein